MKILIGLVLTAALSAAALAADQPDWAYPVTPPPGQLDNVTMKSVPGSSQQYTQAQIDDPFNPPDWFPNEHPADAASGGPWRTETRRPRLRAMPSAFGRGPSGIRQPRRPAGELHHSPDERVQAAASATIRAPAS